MELKKQLEDYTNYLGDRGILHSLTLGISTKKQLVEEYLERGRDLPTKDELLELKQIMETEKTDFMFGGSVGLKLNRLLERPIGDFDIITKERLYGRQLNNEIKRMIPKDSGRFQVGGKEVLCFNITLGTGRKVDVMYTGEFEDYSTILFESVSINIENPARAIKAKRQYVESNQVINKQKHQQDLEIIKLKLGF
jgi:hypothetical protein